MGYYCSNCRKEVATKREEINVALVILLAIFTGGLGLIIYFIIWSNKDKNRCVHSRTICQYRSSEQLSTEHYQVVNNYGQQQQLSLMEVRQDHANFCPVCGTEVGERQQINFCAYCGSKIE